MFSEARIRSGIAQQRFSPSPRLIVRPVVRVVRGARPRARVADALGKTRWGTRWTRTRRACRTTSGPRMRIDDREAVGIWRNPSRAAGAAAGSENRRRYASIPATGAVARCAPDRRARSRRRPVSRARAIEVARRAARRSRLRHRRRNAKPNENGEEKGTCRGATPPTRFSTRRRVADLAKKIILLFVSRSDDRRPTTSRARLRETPTR